MAAGKPTAVHWFLIVFVMLSAVFGALCYMEYDARVTTQASVEQLKTEKDALDKALREVNDGVNNLKLLIGHDYDDFGDPDDADTATLIGSMQNDIARFGQQLDESQKSYAAAMAKLRDELDNVSWQSQGLRQDKTGLENEIKRLQAQHQVEMQGHLAAVNRAKEEKKRIEQTTREELARNNALITTLRQEKVDLAGQLDDVRQEYDAAQAEWNSREKNLVAQLSNLRKAVDEIQDDSFEREDGLIRWVDHRRGLVWLNLGSADGLPVRTGFSVYTRDNHGIGRRSAEDIKGKIEVTNIVDTHLAEAQILTEDIYRPIAAGDPIYTPLFTAGRQEKFSFVGLIDFDRDDRSDRDRLHAIVESAGAEIDNEVDDNGVLHGSGLTFETKFLVIGRIPSQNESADADERKWFQDIGIMHGRLEKQAQEQGVRIVSLGQFLDYIGHVPQMRLWSPGEDMPYRLKRGLPTLRIEEYGGTVPADKVVTGGYARSVRLRDYSRRRGSSNRQPRSKK